VDVVEIDAASNRGIDEIRQLRQNVAVRPARGRFKVYIIDEVHMLTREAFNALLKTLEEPPGHVKFVLCTTEPEKLPITILSRCQRFDFVTVDVPAIARRLAQIVEAEGASVSAEALHLIARRAAGSMRDSQSLLEQLLGSAAGPIGVDDVHAVIGTGREERIGELLAAVADRDGARALKALDAALQGGADPGGVLEQLLAALRDCMLASVGCEPALLSQSQGLGVDLQALGRQLGTATVLAMLQILDQSLSRMRVSGHATVLAEMAVVRLAALEDLESLSAAIDRLAAAEPAAAAQSSAGPRPAAARPGPEKKTTDLTAAAADEARPTPVAAQPRPAVPAQQEPAQSEAAVELPADACQAWQVVTGTLDGLAADFAGTAAHATWRDGVLEVTLPANATTAASFLKRPEVAAAIGKVLRGLAGRPVPHSIVSASASVAQQTASAPAAPRPAAPSQVTLLREAADHPLVSHARTLFDAAIRTVEPPRVRQPQPAAAVAGARGAEASSSGDEASVGAVDTGVEDELNGSPLDAGDEDG
jgi:DNA polymerase-3 subunit gamma/tau